MNSAIWGLLGVALGGVIQISSERLRGHSASSLSLAQRDHEIRVGRDDFQRKNLLEIQEGLARWVRAEAKINFFDREQVATLGHLTGLPADLSDESFDSRRQLSFRIERVTDNDLRGTLTLFTENAAKLEAKRIVDNTNASVQLIDSEMQVQVEQYSEVLEILGKTLRQYL